MYYYHLKKFEDFDNFLACNNWPILLKKVEKKYLTPSKVAALCRKGVENSIAEIVKRFLVRKHKFEVKCIDA